jgi:hypothetical protein
MKKLQRDKSDVSEDDEGNASNPECNDPAVGRKDKFNDKYGLIRTAPYMERAGLRVIQPKCLEIFPKPLLLTCLSCKKGVTNVDHITKPKSAYGHGEKLDDELKRALKSWREKFSQYLVTDQDRKVPIPTNRPAPFKGLNLYEGFRCGDCNYACKEERTMRKHWSIVNKKGACMGALMKKTKVQTYFESVQVFFPVNSDLDQDGSQPSLFNLYMERFEKEMERAHEQQILPPQSEHDIPPLLKGMLWHEHLEPFLIDKSGNANNHFPMYAREKVESLRSVIALPKPLKERIPLRFVTFAYLSKIKREFKLCGPRLKRMLVEYPST